MKNRIAYIVSAGNGLESFVYREIDYLVENKLDIHIYATKLKANDLYSPKSIWPTVGFPYSLLFFLTIPILLYTVFFHNKLLIHALKNNSLIDLIFAVYFSADMKKSEVDKIHCHFGDHKLFIGYYCKRILKIPLSVTIHSHELHVNPNEKMFKTSLEFCDEIYAISKLAVKIMVERYEIPEKKITLSHLCVDTNSWLNEKPIRVLTVGRFQPQKGFDDLFKAAKILENKNIEFIVVGFGPLNVKGLAKEIGVEDKVTFFEKMDCKQLQFLYQNVDIYCLPSITHKEQGMEGIPVVLMEAMASSLPVVATNSGAVSEIVSTKLVNERSPEDLAGAINEYALNQELRIEDGKLNRQIIEDEFSLKNLETFRKKLIEFS